MIQRSHMRWCVVGAVLLAAVPLGSASVSDPALLITADNGTYSTSLPIPLSQFTYDPVFHEWDYTQVGAVNLSQGSHIIGQIEALSAFMVDDPSMGVSIFLQYTMRAGSSLTNFTIDTGVVSFSPIPQPLAAASMSDTFNLTDLNGDSYAWCQSLDNYAYKTYYGQASSPNEYFFHGSDSVGSFGGTGQGGVFTAGPDNWPLALGTYESLPVAVDRIRTTAGFSVTAQDKVQVQSSFLLDVPEPAAGLIALTGALLLRRRR